MQTSHIITFIPGPGLVSTSPAIISSCFLRRVVRREGASSPSVPLSPGIPSEERWMLILIWRLTLFALWELLILVWSMSSYPIPLLPFYPLPPSFTLIPLLAFLFSPVITLHFLPPFEGNNKKNCGKWVYFLILIFLYPQGAHENHLCTWEPFVSKWDRRTANKTIRLTWKIAYYQRTPKLKLAVGGASVACVVSHPIFKIYGNMCNSMTL